MCLLSPLFQLTRFYIRFVANKLTALSRIGHMEATIISALEQGVSGGGDGAHACENTLNSLQQHQLFWTTLQVGLRDDNDGDDFTWKIDKM